MAQCCLSLTRTSCAELRGWIRYLLDSVRLLHQKHYRKRRHLLAELSMESKYALKSMKNFKFSFKTLVLNTRAEKRRAEHRSPGPRQRHSQPHILAMSCPSAGTLGRCEGCTQSMQATSPDYRHSDCGIYCAGGYIQVTVHPGQLLHPGQHSPRKTGCSWLERVHMLLGRNLVEWLGPDSDAEFKSSRWLVTSGVPRAQFWGQACFCLTGFKTEKVHVKLPCLKKPCD